MTTDDLVGDRASFNVTRPADHARHAKGAFPVGGFLVAERRGAAIGPTVFVRTVVGGVEDDGVVSDASVIQSLEDLADLGVVLNHAVVVLSARGEAGLVAMLGFHVREGVHARAVKPAEEWLVRLRLARDVIDCGVGGLVVDRLHALPGQRAGVLNGLLADAAPAGLLGRVVGIGSLAAQHAARSKRLLELWILRIGQPLRLLLGIEVIEVAEELIEAVDRRKILVQITQVILTELPGRITLSFQELRRGHVAVLGPEGGARPAALRQASTQRALTSNER